MNTCRYNEGRDCAILKTKSCDNCKFTQTQTQHNSSITKCHKRIANLRNIEQESIAEKYYNGKKPWKNK